MTEQTILKLIYDYDDAHIITLTHLSMFSTEYVTPFLSPLFSLHPYHFEKEKRNPC